MTIGGKWGITVTNGDISLMARFLGLSRREAQIVLLKGQGLTHPQIAAELGLRPESVRSQFSKMLARRRDEGHSTKAGSQLYELVFQAGIVFGIAAVMDSSRGEATDA